MFSGLKKSAAVVFLVAVLGFPAAASAGPWMVENQTGRPLCQLYLSPAGANRWGEDLLAGRCLAPGRRQAFDRAPDPGPHDLLVIFEDGGSRTYFGPDPAVWPHLVLHETEAELFEWDPAATGSRPLF